MKASHNLTLSIPSFLTEDTVEDIAEKHGLMPGEVDPKAAQALVSGTGSLLSELHGNEFDDALLLKQLIFANVTAKQRVVLFLVKVLYSTVVPSRCTETAR